MLYRNAKLYCFFSKFLIDIKKLLFSVSIYDSSKRFILVMQ